MLRVCVDDDDDVNSICVANTNCYLEIDSVTVAAAACAAVLSHLQFYIFASWKDEN